MYLFLTVILWYVSNFDSAHWFSPRGYVMACIVVCIGMYWVCIETYWNAKRVDLNPYYPIGLYCEKYCGVYSKSTICIELYWFVCSSICLFWGANRKQTFQCSAIHASNSILDALENGSCILTVSPQDGQKERPWPKNWCRTALNREFSSPRLIHLDNLELLSYLPTIVSECLHHSFVTFGKRPIVPLSHLDSDQKLSTYSCQRESVWVLRLCLIPT